MNGNLSNGSSSINPVTSSVLQAAPSILRADIYQADDRELAGNSVLSSAQQHAVLSNEKAADFLSGVIWQDQHIPQHTNSWVGNREPIGELHDVNLSSMPAIENTGSNSSVFYPSNVALNQPSSTVNRTQSSQISSESAESHQSYSSSSVQHGSSSQTTITNNSYNNSYSSSETNNYGGGGDGSSTNITYNYNSTVNNNYNTTTYNNTVNNYDTHNTDLHLTQIVNNISTITDNNLSSVITNILNIDNHGGNGDGHGNIIDIDIDILNIFQHGGHGGDDHHGGGGDQHHHSGNPLINLNILDSDNRDGQLLNIDLLSHNANDHGLINLDIISHNNKSGGLIDLDLLGRDNHTNGQLLNIDALSHGNVSTGLINAGLLDQHGTSSGLIDLDFLGRNNENTGRLLNVDILGHDNSSTGFIDIGLLDHDENSHGPIDIDLLGHDNQSNGIVDLDILPLDHGVSSLPIGELTGSLLPQAVEPLSAVINGVETSLGNFAEHLLQPGQICDVDLAQLGTSLESTIGTVSDALENCVTQPHGVMVELDFAVSVALDVANPVMHALEQIPPALPGDYIAPLVGGLEDNLTDVAQSVSALPDIGALIPQLTNAGGLLNNVTGEVENVSGTTLQQVASLPEAVVSPADTLVAQVVDAPASIEHLVSQVSNAPDIAGLPAAIDHGATQILDIANGHSDPLGITALGAAALDIGSNAITGIITQADHLVDANYTNIVSDLHGADILGATTTTVSDITTGVATQAVLDLASNMHGLDGISGHSDVISSVTGAVAQPLAQTVADSSSWLGAIDNHATVNDATNTATHASNVLGGAIAPVVDVGHALSGISQAHHGLLV